MEVDDSCIEQEKFVALLSSTISSLCRNGLLNRTVARVDGLLGITLTNNEVFLVNIQEQLREPSLKREKQNWLSDVSAVQDNSCQTKEAAVEETNNLCVADFKDSSLICPSDFHFADKSTSEGETTKQDNVTVIFKTEDNLLATSSCSNSNYSDNHDASSSLCQEGTAILQDNVTVIFKTEDNLLATSSCSNSNYSDNHDASSSLCQEGTAILQLDTIKSQKEKQHIMLDGYRYRKDRIGVGDSVSWRCVKTGCRGRVRISKSNDVLAKFQHSHAPDKAKNEVLRAKAAMRAKAIFGLEDPGKIIEQCSVAVSPEASSKLPSSRASRRMIARCRRKRSTFCALPFALSDADMGFVLGSTTLSGIYPSKQTDLKINQLNNISTETVHMEFGT